MDLGGSGVLDEAAFLDQLTARLAELPGVLGVALGGSRAQGTARPDSDWDLAVYYRDVFDPQDLRDLGWPGEVSEIGGWGGGIFNGGGWLTVDGVAVDVHYRDLSVIDHIQSEAEAGRFWTEPLMFHVAGIPSYLLLAELALNRTLSGDLPRPDYPPALQAAAPGAWWSKAQMLFDYTARYHARQGRTMLCLGLLTEAAAVAAHAVLAEQARWITNDKQLLAAAGLDTIDELLIGVRSTDELPGLVTNIRTLCERRLAEVS